MKTALRVAAALFGLLLVAQALLLSPLFYGTRRADLATAGRDRAGSPGLPGARPRTILETGKDPGLGVRELHRRGITGRGVGLAIIDGSLSLDHREYSSRLRVYEEIHCFRLPRLVGEAGHGTAVASIAVGQTVGVGPGADLYYIAQTPGTWSYLSLVPPRLCLRGLCPDLGPVARSIERVIAINHGVAREHRIRVLSISMAWESFVPGYNAVMQAIRAAEREGIFVVSGWLPETRGFHLNGLGRDPERDPAAFTSYGPGARWADRFFAEGPGNQRPATLLAPMDARTVAGFAGPDDYLFHRTGGISWAIPYVAGLYALACQVQTGIEPGKFWQTALATGRTVAISTGSRRYALGRIVDPVALVERLAAPSRHGG